MREGPCHIRGIQRFQGSVESHRLRSSRRVTTARGELQETIRAQSEQAWTKAETPEEDLVFGCVENTHTAISELRRKDGFQNFLGVRLFFRRCRSPIVVSENCVRKVKHYKPRTALPVEYSEDLHPRRINVQEAFHQSDGISHTEHHGNQSVLVSPFVQTTKGVFKRDLHLQPNRPVGFARKGQRYRAVVGMGNWNHFSFGPCFKVHVLIDYGACPQRPNSQAVLPQYLLP